MHFQSNRARCLTQSTNSYSEPLESVEVGADELNPLGQDVKEAIAAMGRLEILGLQKQSINFPKCIVLGKQASYGRQLTLLIP